ncbi:MAG: MBL fold metallo-hydrolase [Proteobacteria bacterium]|nr:MBL fold metallo-hydrolase [Pseudomonadota bacterium]
MLIRCWGSRGSIAVSGKEYLKYGGDTACIEVVGEGGDTLILDAGTGIRRLGTELMKRRKKEIHLLLTHAHWDHLSGFPFFKPIYSTKFDIKVYGPQETQASLKRIVSKTMASPYFPVELDAISADISFLGMGNKDYSIGSFNINTIPISHTNEGVGYRLEEGGRSFVFLTDNELKHTHPTGVTYSEYVEFVRGADILFHDAEFKKSEYRHTEGWGHSVFTDTVALALDAGVKSLGLFHHNQERTDKEIDAMVKEARELIRKKGKKMKCFAVAQDMEIEL